MYLPMVRHYVVQDRCEVLNDFLRRYRGDGSEHYARQMALAWKPLLVHRVAIRHDRFF